MFAFFAFWLLSLTTTVSSFVHPGLLVSDEDISRAKRHIAAGQDPWLSSWEKLTSIQYASPSYISRPVSSVNRSENGELLWQDTAAAFNLALRWKLSGDGSCADAAARILSSWAKTLRALDGGDDMYLTAGLQGYEIANAAELLRDYAPFAASDLSAVVTMMTEVFLPMNRFFLDHGAGSEHNHKHFYANWELCNIASMLAIAVLSDNATTWDYAVDYFKNGTGNGAINNAIVNIVQEPGTGKPLGQGQEEGRDQGHSALDYQLLAAIGQQAWNQGEDLFAYNDNRILLGAEYFARYNLGYDVPFEPYTNGLVYQNEISSASRGAIRPTWELLYSHYVGVKQLDAPWTEAFLNQTLEYFKGFEGGAGSWGEGSGHYDGLGWGSLLYRMDASDLANLHQANASSQSTTQTVTSSASIATTTSNALNSTKSTVYTGGPSPTTLTTIIATTANPSIPVNVGTTIVTSPVATIRRCSKSKSKVTSTSTSPHSISTALTTSS